MNMFRTHKHLFATLLLGILVGQYVLPAQAAIIGTQSLLVAEQAKFDRQQVLSALDQHQIAEQLEAMGVDTKMVKERLARLTPEELSALSNQLEKLPAGSGVIEILLLIFIIFIITDALGVTDIFPFVHPLK